ncbi:MAG: hypothetical protein Q9211_006461, partial [Gyalolechia sp. 1 TL-2023]
NDLPSALRSRERIDRCVVLGLGSLSNGRRSSWWELVFLESVLDFLSLSSSAENEGPHDERLPVYIQDPLFNDVDIAFFNSLGFIVLSHPEAFEHMSTSTFLFAPHLELEVYRRTLKTAKPRLCVGTDLGECTDRQSNYERRTEKEVFSQYQDATLSRRLPEFERDPWTQFTSISWMQSTDE